MSQPHASEHVDGAPKEAENSSPRAFDGVRAVFRHTAIRFLTPTIVVAVLITVFYIGVSSGGLLDEQLKSVRVAASEIAPEGIPYVLPRRIVEASVRFSVEKCELLQASEKRFLSVQLGLLPDIDSSLIADPSASYVLRFQSARSWAYTSDIHVTLTPPGYISELNATSQPVEVNVPMRQALPPIAERVSGPFILATLAVSDQATVEERCGPLIAQAIEQRNPAPQPNAPDERNRATRARSTLAVSPLSSVLVDTMTLTLDPGQPTTVQGTGARHFATSKTAENLFEHAGPGLRDALKGITISLAVRPLTGDALPSSSAPAELNGVGFRVPREMLVELCRGSCLRDEEGGGGPPRRLLKRDRISFPQLGTIVTLPIIRRPFTNDVISASTDEDGWLNRVSVNARARPPSRGLLAGPQDAEDNDKPARPAAGVTRSPP